MDKKIIQSTADKIKLKNIVLNNSKLLRNDNIDPLMYPKKMQQQNMYSVYAEEITYESDDGSLDIFRVYVNFGARAVELNDDMDSEIDDPKILYNIEASYRLDYELLQSLSKEEANEFSKFNSVHNAWPFWREHVYTTLRSADLPMLNIPLMKGKNFPDTKKDSKIKKKREHKN